MDRGSIFAKKLVEGFRLSEYLTIENIGHDAPQASGLFKGQIVMVNTLYNVTRIVWDPRHNYR